MLVGNRGRWGLELVHEMCVAHQEVARQMHYDAEREEARERAPLRVRLVVQRHSVPVKLVELGDGHAIVELTHADLDVLRGAAVGAPRIWSLDTWCEASGTGARAPVQMLSSSRIGGGARLRLGIRVEARDRQEFLGALCRVVNQRESVRVTPDPGQMVLVGFGDSEAVPRACGVLWNISLGGLRLALPDGLERRFRAGQRMWIHTRLPGTPEALVFEARVVRAWSEPAPARAGAAGVPVTGVGLAMVAPFRVGSAQDRALNHYLLARQLAEGHARVA